MKNVILITNSFPFGIAEAGFLAPEYEVLKEKADVYTVTRNTKDKMTTSVPEDRIFRYASHYGKSCFCLFFKSVGFSHVLQRARIFKAQKKVYFFKCEACVNDAYESFLL